METHYYFGWFNDTMPKKVGVLLNEDLSSKKSLVMICTAPSDYEGNDRLSKWVKESWFDFAGVVFDEYHWIDYRLNKEEAGALLRNASAILLHGGYPHYLKDFLAEYGMVEAIKESKASVVMGASAGAMNLSTNFAYGKRIDDHHREPTELYDGLGLDDFAFISHATKHAEELACEEEVQILSQKLVVYAGCEESTIRVRNGKVGILGDVYLITNDGIGKMPETDFSE